MSTCHNNPEKSSITKINMHTSSGYSLFTNCSFDWAKNKLDCSRREDCMEKFCKILKDHATKIINYGKKEMIPLTDKEVLWKAKSLLRVSLKPPTNQPPTTGHLPTDQPTTDHRTPTNRPLTGKKFEDQKKFEFISDITYDFKCRDLKIMLCIMHTR